MAFKDKIEEILAPLPSEWSEKLTELLVLMNNELSHPDCEEFKECETLTSLSEFSVEDGVVSIQYKDENGTIVTRSFSLAQIINEQLDDIDPACLTDDVTWSNLSYAERLQLLITSHCDCCS